MNTYEKQLQSAADKDVLVIESWDMGNDSDHEPIDGLYMDGCVALSSDLQTIAQRNSVLAEELAHHDLTVGNILDLSDPANRRQEQKARTLAYDRLIGLQGLVRAVQHGCKNRYETAEYLDVTESFLQEAIDRYKEIYGPKFTEFINNHMTVTRELPPEPVKTEEAAAPIIPPEEIQRRIASRKKRRKSLEATWRRVLKRIDQKEREGYDVLAAIEARNLDPDWKRYR